MQEPLLGTKNSGQPSSSNAAPFLPSMPSFEDTKQTSRFILSLFYSYFLQKFLITSLDFFGEVCDGAFTYLELKKYFEIPQEGQSGEDVTLEFNQASFWAVGMALLFAVPLVTVSYKKAQANQQRAGYESIPDNPLSESSTKPAWWLVLLEFFAIASPIGIMTYGTAKLAWKFILGKSIFVEMFSFLTALSLALRRYSLHYFHAHPPQGAEEEEHAADDGRTAWQRFQDLNARGKGFKAMYYAFAIIVGHFIEAFFQCSAGFKEIRMPPLARFLLGLIFSLPIVIYVSNTELRSIFGEMLEAIKKEVGKEEHKKESWAAGFKNWLTDLYLGFASGPHMFMPTLGFIMFISSIICGISSKGEDLTSECPSSILYWPFIAKLALLLFSLVIFGWPGGEGFRQTVKKDFQKACCGGGNDPEAALQEAHDEFILNEVDQAMKSNTILQETHDEFILNEVTRTMNSQNRSSQSSGNRYHFNNETRRQERGNKKWGELSKEQLEKANENIDRIFGPIQPITQPQSSPSF